jgi:exo-beta-1,3-glucanase (GH17 family)
MNYVEAHQNPAPWTHSQEGLGDYIHNAKGECVMSEEKYSTDINLTDEEWKIVAAAPTLVKVVRDFLSVMARFGNWDEGCFYYNSVTASELQKPIADAEAALTAAGASLAS